MIHLAGTFEELNRPVFFDPEYWPVAGSFVIFRHHTGRKRGVYIAIRPDRPNIFISGEFQNPNQSVWWNDRLSRHRPPCSC